MRILERDNRPICWTDVYVIPEYASVGNAIGKNPTPVYRLVEDLFGENVTEVRLDLLPMGFPMRSPTH